MNTMLYEYFSQFTVGKTSVNYNTVSVCSHLVDIDFEIPCMYVCMHKEAGVINYQKGKTDVKRS